ncbi:hypothetical protein J8J14_20095 [Roseomonas sp. SSH11]|uniref:Uncharacterized protein n=1 Tax=Pararoseomonas baculiformis TaxID=2820812 RepID=A0ABS4AJ77_9PROT|nr:hypothetical protein [Pararoseomonas baculiformis]MBP0447081.1 hypothetical protein [Pararoseomonas baculiformis]
MRWIIASFFVFAFAGLAGTSHAVTPGAVTTAVESAREVTSSVTQEVARRRAPHRRVARHRRPAASAQ